VSGSWKATRKGTRFVFVPGQALNSNEEYKIIITPKVKDQAGTPLAKERVVKFGTGA